MLHLRAAKRRILVALAAGPLRLQRQKRRLSGAFWAESACDTGKGAAASVESLTSAPRFPVLRGKHMLLQALGFHDRLLIWNLVKSIVIVRTSSGCYIRNNLKPCLHLRMASHQNCP